MRRIYKYPLQERLGGITVITARINRLLNILNQPSTGNCLWCEVDDDADEVKMTILTLGTGVDYDPTVLDNEEWEYIGTAIDTHGCVWHYYAHFELADPEWGDYVGREKAPLPKEKECVCGR